MQSQAIVTALRPGVNWAGISYQTQVATAAAHRSRCVVKHTRANVQLFANIVDASRVYRAAVVRSAVNLGQPVDLVSNFESSSNWYEHTQCHSIVRHRRTGELYLWCIYNSAASEYTIDGGPADRNAVAALLTPSAAGKLLNPPTIVHNVANGIDHTVQVRVIALSNINEIVVNRQTLCA